jgi:hypothetical protein
MREYQDAVQIIEGGEDVFAKHKNDLMDMFNEASFGEKWSHVREGLKQPASGGVHKWARLQCLRLLSPAMAVVVPFLILMLIILFAHAVPEKNIERFTKVITPEPPTILDDKTEVPLPDPVKPIEFEFDTPDINVETAVMNPSAPVEVVSLQSQLINAVSPNKSPIIMKSIYSNRCPGGRQDACRIHNGEGTDVAVLRALRHLKKIQNSDGSWGKNKVAMTSMALLAYLAHGEKPASYEFGSTVQSAITYIMGEQTSDGYFRGSDSHNYTQPIAAYALAEAYAVIMIPDIRDAAVKAVIPVVKGQNSSGGFNYNLKPTTRDDTSYMAWCVQALKAAEVAGLSKYVDGLDRCFKKSADGFKKNYGEQDGYGSFGYTSFSANSGLSGAGVLCLQFLGEAGSRECRGGVRGLSKWTFNWQKPRAGSFLYYMYYVTQVKFHEGGVIWKKWNGQFKPGLLDNQKVLAADVSGYVDHNGIPHETGSWISPAKNEHNGSNQVMDTILCTLMLEVYYRYLQTSIILSEDDNIEELSDENGDIVIKFSETPELKKCNSGNSGSYTAIADG